MFWTWDGTLVVEWDIEDSDSFGKKIPLFKDRQEAEREILAPEHTVSIGCDGVLG